MCIIIVLSAIVLLFLYLFILKPLVPLLILKVQLGEKAILMFYPLSGFFYLLTSSGKKYNDILKLTNDVQKKNPKAVVVLTNFMHKPFLFITGPEYIKDMYVDYHNYAKYDPFMIPNFGQAGLALSEGKNWKRQRKLLGEAFTFEKLKARLPMMNTFINRIAQSDSKHNLNLFTSNITGQIAIESFLGKKAEGLQLEGKDAQVALIEIMNDIFLLRVNNPYVLLKQIILEYKSWDILPIKKEKQLMERINNFKNIVSQLITERIEELRNKEPEDPQNMVFLDLYVTEYLKEQNSENKNISIQEIFDQFVTLFFTGTDTTATLSGTCLYYLAQFPEIQQEILEEVKSVIGDGEVKEYHLNKLEKVNALINEVLRMRNPSFTPVVRIVKNDQSLLDIKLKKGWFICQYHNAASQLDKHFENAGTFNIKRWLNNKTVIQNDNGFIHIPFAAGQRNCIGQHMAVMEAKVIIAIMVRKYQIKLNPNVKQIIFGLKFLYCVEPDDCLQYELREQ